VLRVVGLLIVGVLVNLPMAHQAWTGHRIDQDGREVEAVVTRMETVNGSHLVDYHLPASLDGKRKPTTYSARVDDATYDTARQTKRLAVRAVPGKLSLNRVDGEVSNNILVVIGIVADFVLLAVVLLMFLRGRRWRERLVVGVDGDLVTFTIAEMTLTAQVPEGRGVGLQAGDRIRGPVHLLAESDLLSGVPVSVLEQRRGASYLVRGRLTDAVRDHVDLQLDDGFTLRVLVGPFRNRAGLRDHAEVTGTLVLERR
jgi:hypothetical protein